MSIPHPAASPHDELAHLQSAWWQLLALGVVSMAAGVLALGAAVAATLASVLVLGVLLVIAGVTEVMHAFVVRNARSFALHLLGAGMYLIVGVFMLEDPLQAANVLTLLLAASFFVGGVLRILFAGVARFRAWTWVVLNGVVDIVLALMVFNRWPESGLWVIGTFIGIDLLFHGWSWVVMALHLRGLSASQPA